VADDIAPQQRKNANQLATEICCRRAGLVWALE